MRHEITCDAVVGVIEQNFHRGVSDSAKRCFADCLSKGRNPLRQRGGVLWRLVVWKRSSEYTLAYSITCARILWPIIRAGAVPDWESGVTVTFGGGSSANNRPKYT